MADLVGQTIGSYRLVEKLGTGGMAEVYKAYQPRLDRYVAIKFIRPEFVTEEGFRARFEQEAKAIARLSHTNIVHVYDFGEEGNRYYLVMEFIAGGTLKDRLQSLNDAGETMDLDEAHGIIRQVGEALDYAHRQGIIHRDIKPANIMLTPDSRAVLNDFGVARMVEATAGLTSTGAAIGTPAYMSPEQIEGDKTKVGPASDLYALGVVLYEMVTGRVPFTADTPLAVMLKHLNDPIALPRTFNPTLPEDVERIILKALAKDPAERYRTASELARELGEIPQGSLGAPVTPIEPPFQPGRRKIPWLWASLLAVLLLIVFGCIVIAGGMIRAWLQSGKEMAQATLLPGSTVTAPIIPTVTGIPPPETTSVSATSTATPAPAPTSMPTSTATRSAASTRTPESTSTATPMPTATSTGAGTATVSSQLVAVPDAVVDQFFSPGPDPAGLTVAGDTLWVADGKQRRLYQLDHVGTPLASFPITHTGTINGLTWDGEALCLALGKQVVRFDTTGKVLESFPLPVSPRDLGWNLDSDTLWTASRDRGESFLLEFNAHGRLLQSFHAPVLGWADGLDWAPDGLWVVDAHRYWYRFSFAGQKLHSARLGVGASTSYSALAWDENGHLWLVSPGSRQIYRLSLRQQEVSSLSSQRDGELALPRPQLEPAPSQDGASVHVTNNLEGILSLSFGKESAILAPGQTWSAGLTPGVYEVFASTSVPEPIAFSSQELLVGGYEYTWSLVRPN